MSDKKEEILADVNKALEKQPEKTVTALTTFKGYSGKEITELFEKYKERLSQLTRVNPDKIVETAIQMILTNPKLVECTITSIAGALMQSAILDLEVVPQLGNCYFVPYGKNIGTKEKKIWIKEVQFQIGYRGWLTLVRRSAQIKWIDAFEVSQEEFEKGLFKIKLGLKPDIQHERIVNIDVKLDGSNLAHVYAVCELMNGAIQFKTLSKEQVENYRKRSPAQGEKAEFAWQTDYPAMAKAKVLKQLCKFLPLEQHIQEAIATDEAVINETAIQGNKVNLASVTYPDSDAESVDVTTESPLGEDTKPVDATFEEVKKDEPKKEEPPKVKVTDTKNAHFALRKTELLKLGFVYDEKIKTFNLGTVLNVTAVNIYEYSPKEYTAFLDVIKDAKKQAEEEKQPEPKKEEPPKVVVPLKWIFVKGSKKLEQTLQLLKDFEIDSSKYHYDGVKPIITIDESIINTEEIIEVFRLRKELK
jgi:recombination protein RecT